MSDNGKNYFVPEQLDDNDFEKEKMEKKKAKKEEGFKLNKQVVKHTSVKIVSILLIIAFIGLGIYLYLNPIQRKSTAPEKAAKDFCAYLNAGNWKKVNDLIDFKGFYVLGAVLDEAEYTKFDIAYKNLDEEDETYIKFMETANILTSLDDEDLDSVSIQIRIKNIEACNKIQSTDTLYKLRVNFDYIYDGQAENMTDVIYLSNASGEYKMVYGEWMQTVLNYYQSIYVIKTSYGY